MSASIMDKDLISQLNFRKLPIHGELIVIFAEAAGDVIYMVGRGVFLAQHGDMVIGAIHSGTHEIGRTSVQTDIVLIDFFLMDSRSHQAAVRAGHKATQLRVDSDIAPAGGDENFLESLADALSNGENIVFLLVGLIG